MDLLPCCSPASSADISCWSFSCWASCDFVCSSFDSSFVADDCCSSAGISVAAVDLFPVAYCRSVGSRCR